MIKGVGHRRRHRIGKRDGWICRFCGKKLACHICEPATYKRDRATIDHLVPKIKGGTTGIYNLVLACGDCNCRKGSLDPGEPIPPAKPKKVPDHWYMACVTTRRSGARVQRRGFATEADAVQSFKHVPKPLEAWLCDCGSWHVRKRKDDNETG